TINVELMEDMKILDVQDSGRGIPMEGETDGTPNYELLFLILFAGTKYGEGGEMDGSYTGTNGSGQTVLNYTSSLFEVTSVRDGKEYHIKFEDGGILSEPITEKETDKESGTTVKFRLDPEIYTETEFTNEQVKNIVKRYAVSSNKITINYKHKDEEVTYHYDHLEEYFDEVIGDTSTSSVRYGDSVLFDDGGEKTSIELALATTTEIIQESYLNINYLPNGGTINNGIINGVKLYMNKFCRDNSLFPKGVRSFADSD